MPVTGIALTVTSQVPYIPLPSTAVALITVVPGATGVTTPSGDTVATVVSSLLHSSSFVDAKVGSTVAATVCGAASAYICIELGFNTTDSTKARSEITLVEELFNTYSFELDIEAITFFISMTHVSAISLSAVTSNVNIGPSFPANRVLDKDIQAKRVRPSLKLLAETE